MGELFVYILKSSLCLAAFYLFYKLMLSKETFHKFNRVVLIALFVFSFVIPFIQITLHKEIPYTGAVNLNLEALMAMAQLSTDAAPQEPVQNPNYWIMLLFVVYIIGVAVSFFKTSLSFAKMFSLIRSKDSERKNLAKNIVLVIHKREIAPFSWMKYIVVSEKDYQESGKEIISHEFAHISRLHSIDLLIAEIVKIVNWFNPAVYLLKQELQNIHEYQADEAVINKGIDAKQYQLLLIKKAVGARLYTIANSFNHSKLKNRITMISKKKSTRVAALKALFVFPLTAFALVAFASQEVTSKMEVISSTKITDFIQNDTIKKAEKQLINIKVDSKDTTNKRVIVTSSGIGISWNHGDNKSMSFSYNYDNDSTRTLHWDVNKAPLIIINGKESSQEIAYAIDRDKIKARTVVKGDKAIELYGDKGKNGVIIISLKNPMEMDNPGLAYKDVLPKDALYVVDSKVQEDFKIESFDPSTIKFVNIIKGDGAIKMYGDKGKNGVVMITTKDRVFLSLARPTIVIRGTKSGSSKDKPLFIVDGEIKDSTVLKTLDPESVQNVSIIKGSEGVNEAVKKYGEKARNGVVYITLKKEGVQIKQSEQTQKNEAQIIIRGGHNAKNQPLFVVDGVVKDDSLAQSINPESINTMYILKGDAAVKKYGEKAGNGVIEITLKTKSENSTQTNSTTIRTKSVGTLKGHLLYVVDGKVMGPDFKLDSINPETIESIAALQDSVNVKKYGERGKNGVILLTLKKAGTSVKQAKQPQKSVAQIVIKDENDTKSQPLIVLDGVIQKNFDMKSIDPNVIQSINVLKADAGVKKYGEKAKNGVLEITLKGK